MLQLLQPAGLDNFYCLLYFNKLLLKNYVGKHHTSTYKCHSFQEINRAKCLLFYHIFLMFYCRLEGRVLRLDYKRDPNRNKGKESQLTDFVKGN